MLVVYPIHPVPGKAQVAELAEPRRNGADAAALAGRNAHRRLSPIVTLLLVFMVGVPPGFRLAPVILHAAFH